MLIHAAVAAVSVAVTALFLHACWRPGGLACTGVYPQLATGFEGDPPSVPDAASPGWEGEFDHSFDGGSRALAADRHPCRCLDGIWKTLSVELPACRGLACLTAVRLAVAEGFASCSGSACLQTLGQSVRGLLSRTLDRYYDT